MATSVKKKEDDGGETFGFWTGKGMKQIVVDILV